LLKLFYLEVSGVGQLLLRQGFNNLYVNA